MLKGGAKPSWRWLVAEVPVVVLGEVVVDEFLEDMLWEARREARGETLHEGQDQRYCNIQKSVVEGWSTVYRNLKLGREMHLQLECQEGARS